MGPGILSGLGALESSERGGFLESSKNLLRYIIKVIVFDKEKTAFIMKEIPTVFEVMLGLRFEGLVGVWNLKLGGLLLRT